MILDKIVQQKKIELVQLKRKHSLKELYKLLGKKRGSHRFYQALRQARGVAVIAEIKRRSPSKGILRKNFKPVEIAKEYASSGATALSVLTDKKFFGGSLSILKKVRKCTTLPILRKDFVLEEYQIVEAALAGADAILLIASILTREQLQKLARQADRLGLDVLFEIHDAADAKKIAGLKPKIVGINNRDLKTFEVDLSTTEKLAKSFKNRCLLVSESGIFSKADLSRVHRAGARAVLVGESFMRAPSPGKALKQLLGKGSL